jgi:hypothetical protein
MEDKSDEAPFIIDAEPTESTTHQKRPLGRLRRLLRRRSKPLDRGMSVGDERQTREAARRERLLRLGEELAKGDEKFYAGVEELRQKAEEMFGSDPE